MAIIRCCSYTAGIKTPIDPAEYSEILVTFSQDKRQIIVKNKAALTLQEDAVKVQLTQEETSLFTAPGTALLQLRAYKSKHDAPGSRMWPIEVYPTNNEEILS